MTVPQEAGGRRSDAVKRADDAIATRRALIDEIDREMIAILQCRIGEAAAIQRIRLASGGTRICPERELEIIRRYGAAFGRHGVELATIVLRLCRGPI